MERSTVGKGVDLGGGLAAKIKSIDGKKVPLRSAVRNPNKGVSPPKSARVSFVEVKENPNLGGGVSSSTTDGKPTEDIQNPVEGFSADEGVPIGADMHEHVHVASPKNSGTNSGKDKIEENPTDNGVVEEKGSPTEKVSYAKVVQSDKPVVKKANFRPLNVESELDGFDVVIPKESVLQVHNKFSNTLVGYFLGKRLAFPVVESYVKNAWAKFGFRRVMMNAAGMFFFKFEGKAGMDKVLELGPWLIRSVPLFLNVWSHTSSMSVSEIKKVPVWVKLHDVPVVVFTEDGLSMLATKLGRPIALDTYTTAMCLDSWGRSNYARALIELDADQGIKKELIVGIPSMDGDGISRKVIKVEYEWNPPHCSTCKVFNHSDAQCPKQQKPQEEPVKDDDGFTRVERKKGRGKVVQPTEKKIDGVKLSKPKPTFVYKPKQARSSGGVGNEFHASTSNSTAAKGIPLKNPFDVLAHNEDVVNSDAERKKGSSQNVNLEDSDDEIEVVFEETAEFIARSEGASTPYVGVTNV